MHGEGVCAWDTHEFVRVHIYVHERAHAGVPWFSRSVPSVSVHIRWSDKIVDSDLYPVSTYDTITVNITVTITIIVTTECTHPTPPPRGQQIHPRRRESRWQWRACGAIPRTPRGDMSRTPGVTC